MALRITLLVVVAPVLLFATLMAVPGLDRSWGSSSFHFYVVTAASLLAAIVCALLMYSARSIKDPRILFLALCFFSLGTIFAIHGITTPGGAIFTNPTAALERSPWMSTLAAGIFATLSVVSMPSPTEHGRRWLPRLVFAAGFATVSLYFVVSLALPDWLSGFPTTKEWFQHVLTFTTVSLLSFAAWRYFQSYQFTRLPSQLAIVTGLVLLAEAQISIDFGTFWYFSWWLYHGLFLLAFASVLVGWGWESLRAGSASAIAEAIAMRDALTQLKSGRSSELVALTDRIENHDLETFRHVDRVAALAYVIGKREGFSSARLRNLVLAAQLHDIGKIGLPRYILTKPGSLTDREWELIREHPANGWQIVLRVRGLDGIANIVRHHHERFDGTGYPDACSGEDIPLESRIISVADTFDALTSARPYRPAMSIDEAKAELECVAGTQLDPDHVANLIAALEEGDVKLDRAPEPVPATI